MKKLCLSFLVFFLYIVNVFSTGQRQQGTVVPFGEAVEDELVISCSTGPDVDWSEAAIPDFLQYIKQKYNKDVKVVLDPGAMAARWTKFTTEWPNPTSDILVVYPNLLLEGIDKGYWVKIVDYLSSDEKNGLDQVTLNLYQGYGLPYDRQFYGPVVRSDLMPFEYNSNADLADSRLTNRVTFDSALKVGSGYLAVHAAAIVLGENWENWRNSDGTLNRNMIEPTLKLVRKWYQNSLTMTEGSGTIRPLLTRGESLVSLWWSQQAITESGKGLNVKFIYPKEGTISWGDTNWAVFSNAPHKNLAIEWCKFIMSKKGYQIAYEKAKMIGYLIPRSDVEPPVEERNFLPPQGTKIHSGNDFRLFIENEKVLSDFLEEYTRIVVEGR
jgi:spermidine/putrescine-binding protein